MGIAVAAAVVGVAATVATGVVRTAAEPVRTAVPLATVSAGTVYVDVSGAVNAPGLYLLGADARAVDAVAAAGGFRDDADRTGVNLARTVSDGEQLVVPVIGALPPGETGAASDGSNRRSSDIWPSITVLPRLEGRRRAGP